MAKLTLSNIINFFNGSATTVNSSNNDSISKALENTLSRDGTSPNQMNANLDMNGFPILNLPAPLNPTDVVRLEDLISAVNNESLVVTFNPGDLPYVRTATELGILTTNSGNVNSAAFRAAIAAQVNKIEFGGGTYNFDMGAEPFILTAGNFEICGAGQYTTIFQTTSTTSDIFHLNGGKGYTFRDMTFQPNTAATAGTFLTATQTFGLIIEHVLTTNYFNHIYLYDASYSTINSLYCLFAGDVTGVFIKVDGTGLGGNLFLNDLGIDGGSGGTQPYAGLQVKNWDGIWLQKSQINQSGFCIEFSPPNGGSFTHFYGSDVSLDTSSIGLYFPATTGKVIRVWFDGSWCGTHTNAGINFAPGCNVSGVRLINHKIVNNYGPGIYFQNAGVDEFQMIGGIISGNCTGNSSVVGAVWYGPGQYNNHTYNGVRIGYADNLQNTQPYAFEFNTANVNVTVLNNIIITNNDLTGNTVSAFGPNLKASFNTLPTHITNRVIKNNLGLKTEASGIISIPSGTQAYAVAHGLDLTPLGSDIILTATTASGGGGNPFIGTLTSSGFNINLEAVPTAAVGIAWQANIH